MPTHSSAQLAPLSAPISTPMSQADMTFTPPDWLDADLTASMLRGIEKEGLRMQSNGFLSQTPHRKVLGSKLTHPVISTDY